MAESCIACKKPNGSNALSYKGRTWWHCSNYHGFSGYFCPQCFDKIRHDAYGKPEDPESYLAMVIIHGKELA